MAKVQEIGPYSAYAIAVKYGYKGTEEEWVKEQEANRKAAEAAAAAAAQSAKDAAASASGVAQSGQQAVQGIKDAQTAAEQAIDTAKQQAVQAAQAEAERAATSAGQAASSAAEAAQSATNAAAEVGKVQSAGTAAVQAVQQAQSTATEAVSAAQKTATQAVSQAQTAAVSAVQEAGTTQTGTVESAGTAAVSAVSNAKTEALSQISAAGTAQVSAVGTAGTSAVEDVNDAKTAALEEIDAANAALPSPTQADAGKVPTVKADGSAYELAGPYAPLSASIRPTASGNPVNITDGVEWPLQGLKVYGKSTQVTTTGAQLFRIDLAASSQGMTVTHNEDGTINVTGTPKAQYENILNFQTTLPAGTYYLSGNGSINAGQLQQQIRINIPNTESKYYWSGPFTLEDTSSVTMMIQYRSAELVNTNISNFFVMLNTGSTALPYEPYTSGKPSPSPEYPQPIVSAGADGSIDLTVSNGASLSQSMTIFTPNGLPGIPVDSGGNYTDASRQQWVCDEVDYETQKYIQNYVKVVFDGSDDENWNARSTSVASKKRYDIKLTIPPAGVELPSLVAVAMCDEFLIISADDTYSVQQWASIDTNGNFMVFCDAVNTDNVTDWKNWLKENPVTLIYQIATPITTPRSAEEVAAYRTLHTYDGVTVVSTAEDVAGIEVRYVADGEKYIDRKISEAIASAAETKLAAYDTLSGAIHEGVNEA